MRDSSYHFVMDTTCCAPWLLLDQSHRWDHWDHLESSGKGFGEAVVELDGSHWFSSNIAMDFLPLEFGELPAGNNRGPAAQRDLDDLVPALVCSAPLRGMKEFQNRHRQASWPPPTIMKLIIKLRGLLVLKGHKKSQRADLEFRFSSSAPEASLAATIEPWTKQSYVAFKYTMKRHLKSRRKAFGLQGEQRSSVGSYHLKNTFCGRWREENLGIAVAHMHSCASS